MHCFYAFIQFETKFPECCCYTVKAGRHFLNDVWNFIITEIVIHTSLQPPI